MSHPEAEEEGSETPAVGRKAGVEDAFLRLKKAIFLSLFLLLELGLILFFTGCQIPLGIQGKAGISETELEREVPS